MIDKICTKCMIKKIYEHLNIDFFSKNASIFKPMGGNFINTYKLYNPQNYSSGVFLRVEYSDRCLKIEGSIRKWGLAEHSLKDTLRDLTAQEYESAILLLFLCLNIDKKYMKYFDISYIEIGMNINVKTSCDNILDKINGFRDANYIDRSTVDYKKYKTNFFEATAYDKKGEIAEPLKKKHIKTIEQDTFLKDNRSFLRVEFKVRGGKARVKDRLGLDNLQETIDCYALFYVFFWENICEIIYNDIESNDFTFDADGMSQKKFREAITFTGANAIGRERINKMASKTEYPRSVRMMIKEILKNSPAKNPPYTMKNFFNGIRIAMYKSMKKSDMMYLFKEGYRLST